MGDGIIRARKSQKILESIYPPSIKLRISVCLSVCIFVCLSVRAQNEYFIYRIETGISKLLMNLKFYEGKNQVLSHCL